jgi:hypothetical protein
MLLRRRVQGVTRLCYEFMPRVVIDDILEIAPPIFLWMDLVALGLQSLLLAHNKRRYRRS